MIRCDTACNGGEAGDYYKKTIVSEASYEGHPKDGNGGRIEAANSRITITDTACKRAMKWDGYGGSRSSHSTSLFSGGSLTGGTVYGMNIVTDLTAVDGCELVPDYRVANSEGENVFRCILHTSEEMAGETVSVAAKIIAGTSFLNDSGQLVTYLAMGSNEVRITGTKIYAGTCLVETDPSANEFFLELAGIPETPDDGGEETPGADGEGTPDDGGQEIPGAGGEGTPDDGGEETPGAGGEGTPDNGGEEAPGTGGEEKPGSGGEETPGTEEGETPGTGGEEAPGTGEGETPGTGEEGTPGTDGEDEADTGSGETPPVTGYEMVVSTNVPGIAVTVFAGEQTLDLQADENGTVRFTIAPDVTEFYVIVDAVKYCCPVTDGIPGGLVMMGPTAVLSGNGMLKEGDLLQLTVDAAPSIEGNTLSYEWYKDGAALEAGGSVLTVPHAALSDAGSYYVVVTESNGQCVSTAALTVSVEAGEETGGSSGGSNGDNTGSSSGGSTGGTSGGNPGSSGSVSAGSSGGGNPGSSGSTSTGGSSGGSSGSVSSGSTSGSSGGASSQNPADEPTADSPEKQEETGSLVAAIQVKPNQKGIALLPASAKNTYQKYFAKTVKLTVEKEPGVTYYYKVVKKGRADSSVKWKKLTGNVIRAAASDTAKRICIRAVDQTGASVVRKTSGFYVDSKKPVVKGVKNKAVYTKPVKIQFSDNISVKAATLNGKKVKNGCKVSKNGTYRLVVTDRAGNKKIVRFTINK